MRCCMRNLVIPLRTPTEADSIRSEHRYPHGALPPLDFRQERHHPPLPDGRSLNDHPGHQRRRQQAILGPGGNQNQPWGGAGKVAA